VLPANPITFVQVEPEFRLPNYIALRFNLRITHVHRGLLLGTGPLVDPGFRGKLLIPMHNLTASDYELATKEALIWIEFTKTTYNCEPIESEAASPRPFEEFPDKKWRLSAEVGIVAPKEGDADRGRCQPALRSTHSVPEALLRVEHHLESGFG
jgi:hypothetical protein